MSDNARAAVHQVRLSGDVEHMQAFLRKHPMECYAVREDGKMVALIACIDDARIVQAGKFDLRHQILESGPDRLKRLKGQIGPRNRFRDGSIPDGVGLRPRV